MFSLKMFMNYAWACSNTLWPYHHCHEGKPADLIAIFLALVCDPLKVLGKYLSNEIRAECSACTLQNHEREAQHFRELAAEVHQTIVPATDDLPPNRQD